MITHREPAEYTRRIHHGFRLASLQQLALRSVVALTTRFGTLGLKAEAAFVITPDSKELHSSVRWRKTDFGVTRRALLISHPKDRNNKQDKFREWERKQENESIWRNWMITPRQQQRSNAEDGALTGLRVRKVGQPKTTGLCPRTDPGGMRTALCFLSGGEGDPRRQ